MMIEIHPCKEIKLIIFFGTNQNNLALCQGMSVPLLKRRVIAMPPWEPLEIAPQGRVLSPILWSILK